MVACPYTEAYAVLLPSLFKPIWWLFHFSSVSSRRSVSNDQFILRLLTKYVVTWKFSWPKHSYSWIQNQTFRKQKFGGEKKKINSKLWTLLGQHGEYKGGAMTKELFGTTASLGSSVFLPSLKMEAFHLYPLLFSFCISVIDTSE